MLREDFQHVCTAYAFHLKIEDDQVRFFRLKLFESKASIGEYADCTVVPEALNDIFQGLSKHLMIIDKIKQHRFLQLA